MNDFWYILRMNNVSQHAFEAARTGEFCKTVPAKRTKKFSATPTQKKTTCQKCHVLARGKSVGFGHGTGTRSLENGTKFTKKPF